MKNMNMDVRKLRIAGIILLAVGAISLLSPIDAIPDMIPYVGWADDALAAVGGVGGLVALIIAGVRSSKARITA